MNSCYPYIWENQINKQGFFVIFLVFSFQDNCMLIGNYKKLLQLLFSIVFVNQENILLEKLHSSKFSVTALFLSYGMDIYKEPW